MSRSPDDLYASSYIPDGDTFKENWSRPTPASPYRDLSPNTAALSAPNGCLTQAPVSRTRDGKPRVMDLNNLGLHGGATQKQPSPPSYDTFNAKWADPRQTPDYARSERMPSSHVEPSMPPEAFAWNVGRLQRMEEAINRVQQSYVSDVRHRYAPTDQDDMSRYAAAIPRPMEPVPPQSPVCWEQDHARRYRRAAERIQQEHVDELRWSTLPAVPNTRNTVNTSNEAQMDQMRLRMQIKQQLETEKLRQDKQRGRQEMSRPVSSKKITPPPAATPYYPTLPPVNPRYNDSGQNKMAPLQEEPRISEAELDEKRRQLMAKKRGKSKEGKKHKKKKEKNFAGEMVDTCGQTEQEAPQQFVPYRPTAPSIDKENTGESYSKRKRRLIGMAPENEVVEDSANLDGSSVYAPSISQRERGSRRYFGPGSVNRDDESDKPVPHPPLIPRQTSQQTMCWNSDTAKRGLGFKSKLRREEEANAKASNTKQTSIAPEVRQKWKTATFN